MHYHNLKISYQNFTFQDVMKERQEEKTHTQKKSVRVFTLNSQQPSIHVYIQIHIIHWSFSPLLRGR